MKPTLIENNLLASTNAMKMQKKKNPIKIKNTVQIFQCGEPYKQ